MKSLPSLDQLKSYEPENGEFKGVLTGVRPTIIVPNLRENWTFLKYKDISKRIRDIASDDGRTDLIKKNKSIINEYCECIEKIDDLLSDVFEKNEKTLSYKNVETLSEIRLDDIAKKHIADDFYSYFMHNYLSAFNDLCPNGFESKEPSMGIANSSKNASLDFRFTRDNFDIGVQIESTEFRIIAKTEAINQHDKIFSILSEYGWFDKDYDKLNKPCVFGHRSKHAKKKNNDLQYWKYGNDKGAKYSFVYQYFTLMKQTILMRRYQN